MINEDLIKLRQTTPFSGALIRKFWLPAHFGIKAVVLDGDCCENLRMKLRELDEKEKFLDC